MNHIKLSVFCLTYNHVGYISDAIEGFLRQKTSFEYNVFIFDDASTDGTSEIVREYVSNYPEIIQAYISPVNTYGKPERQEILNKQYEKYLTGEYIAWCEGDDAWIDDTKLQRQVDFLDKNPNCTMTTHAFQVLNYDTGQSYVKVFGMKDHYLEKRDIILQPNGNLATASLVMRRDVFLRSNGYPRCDVEDFPMQLYAINQGEIYYFNRKMSIYRFMHNGSWCKAVSADIHKSVLHKLRFVQFLIGYNDYSNKQFEDILWEKIVTYLYDITADLCKSQQMEECIVEVSKKDNFFSTCALEELRVVSAWMKEMYQFTSKERSDFESYSYICIMGDGQYSRHIRGCFDYNEIAYKGIVVSEKQNTQVSPNIWSVGEYPYNKNKTLVVVGISQLHEQDIVNVLSENGFKNVMFPIWFRKENYFCKDV